MRLFSPLCAAVAGESGEDDGVEECAPDFSGQLEEPDVSTDLRRVLLGALFANVLVITHRDNRLSEAEVVLLEGCNLVAVCRPRQDLLTSKAESFLSSQVQVDDSGVDCDETPEDLEFGFALNWKSARRVFFVDAKKERDEWMSRLAKALNWRERTSILEIELQEAREAASRYWSRQRALRHHVQKLKSQISCNSEGVLERRCGTQEHDRLCERVVFLEEIVEGLEGKLAEALSSRETAETPNEAENSVREIAAALLEEMERTQRLVKVLSALSEVLPSDVAAQMRSLLKRIAAPVDFSNLPPLARDSLEGGCADSRVEEEAFGGEKEAGRSGVRKAPRERREAGPILFPRKNIFDLRRTQGERGSGLRGSDAALSLEKTHRLFAESPLLSAVPLSPPSVASPPKRAAEPESLPDLSETHASLSKEKPSWRCKDRTAAEPKTHFPPTRLALPNPAGAYTVESPRVFLKRRKAEESTSDSSLDPLTLLLLDDAFSESDKRLSDSDDSPSEDSSLFTLRSGRARTGRAPASGATDFASKYSEIVHAFAALPKPGTLPRKAKRLQRAPLKKALSNDSPELVDANAIANSPSQSKLERSPSKPKFMQTFNEALFPKAADGPSEKRLGSEAKRAVVPSHFNETPKTLVKKQTGKAESPGRGCLTKELPKGSASDISTLGKRPSPPPLGKTSVLRRDPSGSQKKKVAAPSKPQEEPTSASLKSSASLKRGASSKSSPCKSCPNVDGSERGGVCVEVKKAKPTSRLPSCEEINSFPKTPKKSEPPPSSASAGAPLKSAAIEARLKSLKALVDEALKAQTENSEAFGDVETPTKFGDSERPKEPSRKRVASRARPVDFTSNSTVKGEARRARGADSVTKHCGAESLETPAAQPEVVASAEASSFPQKEKAPTEATSKSKSKTAAPPLPQPEKEAEIRSFVAREKPPLKESTLTRKENAPEEGPSPSTEVPAYCSTAMEVSSKSKELPLLAQTARQTAGEMPVASAPSAARHSGEGEPSEKAQTAQRQAAKEESREHWTFVSRGWSGETWDSFVLSEGSGEKEKETQEQSDGAASQARLAQTVGNAEEVECEILTVKVAYEEEGLLASRAAAASTRPSPYDEVSDEERLLSQAREGVIGIRIRRRKYVLGSRARPRVPPQRAAVSLTGRRWSLMREHRLALTASSARLRQRRAQSAAGAGGSAFWRGLVSAVRAPPWAEASAASQLSKRGIRAIGRPYEAGLNSEALERLPAFVENAGQSS